MINIKKYIIIICLFVIIYIAITFNRNNIQDKPQAPFITYVINNGVPVTKLDGYIRYSLPGDQTPSKRYSGDWVYKISRKQVASDPYFIPWLYYVGQAEIKILRNGIECNSAKGYRQEIECII